MERTARKLIALHPGLHTWFGVDKLVFAPMGKNGTQALRRAKELLQEKGFRPEDFKETESEPGFFFGTRPEREQRKKMGI